MTDYQDTVKNYLSSSTIRGIPRVIRSENNFSRIVWLLVLTVLFSVGCEQIYESVADYLNRETTQDHRDYPNVSVPFPSVTVCNLQPLQSHLGHGKLEMNKYVTKIQQLSQQFAFGKLGNLNKELLSVSGLFQNAKRIQIQKLGHKKNVFIKDCIIDFMKNEELHSIPCNLSLTRRFPHPSFFNCYTVGYEPEREVRQIELVLYLDDFIWPQLPAEFDPTAAKHGVVVTIHQLDTYPAIGYHGIELYPGTSTTLRLSTANYSFMEAPYGDCNPELPKTLYTTDPEGGGNLGYLYTQDLCRRICLQWAIINTCSCFDPNLPIPPNFTVYEETFNAEEDDLLSNSPNRKKRSLDNIVYNSKDKKNDEKDTSSFLLPYCLKWIDRNNPVISFENFYNRYRCWKETNQQASKQQDCPNMHCGSRCAKIIHKHHHTTCRWPHESYHSAIYTNYIQTDKITTEPYFIGAQSTPDDHSTSTASTDSNANSRVNLPNQATSQLIMRNFIRLVVQVEQPPKITMVKSVAQFPLSRLLSSLGGTLNLWTGITIIAGVEIIELTLILIHRAFTSNVSCQPSNSYEPTR